MRETAIHASWALLPGGWQKDVRLTFMGSHISTLNISQRRDPTDIAVTFVVPGLPNLHSHAFQRAMAGLTERRGQSEDSFWSWREQMYRFALGMDPDDVEAVAAQSYVEMLEAGFTHVGEFHYLHHDRDGRVYGSIAEMAERVLTASVAAGISMTLLPVLYHRGGFGGAKAGDAQRRFLNTPDQYARLLDATTASISAVDGATLGIAPHSLRAVTPDELKFAAEIAGSSPIHIHIAEQVKEVDDCVAWSGLRPVEWLLRNADVGDAWCLVHATHMNETEIAALARTGAVAGLCPITEANLGDGIFHGREFLRAGGRIGIGSDSNVEIGAASELKMLEYSQRLRERQRNVLSGPGRSTGLAIFEAVLDGGRQALGQDSAGLTEGAVADIVTLAPHSPHLGVNPDGILDAWIFAPSSVSVDSVYARGRLVVENGRHRERERIKSRFDRTMTKLMNA